MERFRKFSVAQREFCGPSFFRGECYFKTAGGARGFPSYYAARKFFAGFSPFGLSEWAPSAHSVYSGGARILPSIGRAELSSLAGFAVFGAAFCCGTNISLLESFGGGGV